MPDDTKRVVTLSLAGLILKIAKRTGAQHEISEDAAFARGDGANIVAGVFDGMGALPFAKEAAEVAVATCCASTSTRPSELLESANRAINEEFGVGSAGVTGAIVSVGRAGRLVFANIGDVRAFVSSGASYRRNCVTRDHSKLARKLGRNPSAREAGANRRLANNLLNSLGEHADIHVDESYRNDAWRTLVLESDGAWGQPRLSINERPSDDWTRIEIRLLARDNFDPVSSQHFSIHM